MPGSRKQSKALMEPFLQKMAVRDSSIVEKPKTTKFQKESHFTTVRETSRSNTKEESNYRKNQGPKNGLELMRTSFPSFTTNSLQIKMQTHQFKKEVKNDSEEISNANTDQNNGNNSKDTIYLPNSELLSARLDRIMNPPSPENSVTHNKNGPANPTTFKSGPKADCSYQRSKLMIMKKELDQVDKDFEKIQNEYDEAEKAYFTAKLNFHRMKMKRDKLLAQLSDLEKELCPEVECKSSLLHFD